MFENNNANLLDYNHTSLLTNTINNNIDDNDIVGNKRKSVFSGGEFKTSDNIAKEVFFFFFFF
jgi:hypothetical protein